jgi:copper chaperone CopZ
MRYPLLISITLAVLFSAQAQAGTIEMKVNGLVCGFCAQGIEKSLRRNSATADVLVSLENRLVAVSTKEGTDIPDADLRKALTDAGYEVKAIERTSRSMETLRSQIQATQK